MPVDPETDAEAVDDGPELKSGALLWTPIETQGDAPSARSGHTLTVIGDKAFVFGGVYRDPKPNNDVHMLRIPKKMPGVQQQPCEWSIVKISGDGPDPRYHHSATVAEDGVTIAIFGGSRTDTERFNDTWLLDTAKKTWTNVSKTNDDGEMQIIHTPRHASTPRPNGWITPRGGRNPPPSMVAESVQ